MDSMNTDHTLTLPCTPHTHSSLQQWPYTSPTIPPLTHLNGIIQVLEVHKGKASRASSLQDKQTLSLNTHQVQVVTLTPLSH